MSSDAWLLLQRTVAATAAWVSAKLVFDHHEPFFAPIAAVVALNASLGERGSNAVRLLLGVGAGIVVGELTVGLLGSGYGTLALSVFVAMAIARALGGARITIAQAAASTILVVASAGGEPGLARLFDALIGAGIALVFSQFLFSPEPVTLLRRAESAALTGMSDGLELAARALERDDAELDTVALDGLRGLRDRLAELARLRHASGRVAQHSLVWRSQMTPVVREKESAGHLDLLGSSCLALTRAALDVRPPDRRTITPSLLELADILNDLAKELGDRRTRQRAADRALEIARWVVGTGTEPDLAAVRIATRMVAADIMVFAGVDHEQALDAIQRDSGEPSVPYFETRTRLAPVFVDHSQEYQR